MIRFRAAAWTCVEDVVVSLLVRSRIFLDIALWSRYSFSHVATEQKDLLLCSDDTHTISKSSGESHLLHLLLTQQNIPSTTQQCISSTDSIVPIPSSDSSSKTQSWWNFKWCNWVVQAELCRIQFGYSWEEAQDPFSPSISGHSRRIQ